MANFEFTDMDDDELDLGVGGDTTSARPERPVNRQATPQPASQAASPFGKPVTAARTPHRTAAGFPTDALKNPQPVAPKQAPVFTPAPKAQPAAKKPLTMPGRPQTPQSAPTPQAPVYQEPQHSQEPRYEEPRYEEPRYEEPRYEEPARQEQAYRQPVPRPQAQRPEPVYQEPAYEQESYQQPRQQYREPQPEYRQEAPRRYDEDYDQDRRREREQRDLFDKAPAAEVVQVEEEEAPRKGGFFAKSPKKGSKNSKNGKNVQQKQTTKRQSAYSGGRNKVLWLRIGVFVVVGFLMFLGLKSVIVPASGPTRAQVQAAALEAVGKTDFPSEAGSGFATAFTKEFLSYDNNTREERLVQLAQFAPESVINTIDVRYRTKDDTVSLEPEAEGAVPSPNGENTAAETPAAPNSETPAVAQTVTQGPYFVGAKNVDDKSSVITTLTQVNGNQWIYLQIPLIYDPTNQSLSVSGYPSFMSPTQVAKVPSNTGVAKWNNDTEVSAQFEPDLENYLISWAASNSTIISRYVTQEASVAALGGLQGTVQFSKIASLSVETLPDATLDQNTRRAQVEVVWVDPDSGLVYTQSYRMVIKFTGQKWNVDDITNTALIPGDAPETPDTAQ